MIDSEEIFSSVQSGLPDGVRAWDNDQYALLTTFLAALNDQTNTKHDLASRLRSNAIKEIERVLSHALEETAHYLHDKTGISEELCQIYLLDQFKKDTQDWLRELVLDYVHPSVRQQGLGVAAMKHQEQETDFDPDQNDHARPRGRLGSVARMNIAKACGVSTAYLPRYIGL
ncbi:hypothetical protein [Bifidobacterium crudilactis]|jgi:hypothetical protein|uniref:hypothetical protein n=1 Tax=Bifidobacterium crudilactis TaxID=327277 RepID=UPI00235736CE|nr:hypothetical protein [Bifidobacterium crudilactis]MCI1218555.1 family 10 glycosylhydrolase [Bifidobacterium crudilactis]